MRIVRTGTPATLYRLTKADLRNKDLRYSHFEYVDASGLDLSRHDLSYTDWWWSKCDGVTLPVNGTEWILTRYTSWVGTAIPRSLQANAISLDLLIEGCRQALVATQPLSVYPIVNAILDYLEGDYTVCLSDAIQHVAAEGHDLKLLKVVYESSARKGTDTLLQLSKQTAPGGLVNFKSGRAAVPQVDFDDGSPFSIGRAVRRDRWLLARELEKLLDTLYAGAAPWTVLVYHVKPYPLIDVDHAPATGGRFLP